MKFLGLAIILALGACTPAQLMGKVQIASEAIDAYTQEQILAKREWRAKKREVIAAAANSLVAQGKYEEALDLLEKHKPLLGELAVDIKRLRKELAD